GAVVVVGRHPKLLLALAGDQAAGGLDLQPGQLRFLPWVEGHPLANPSGDRLILGRPDGEPTPPAVGDRRRRLPEEEALPRLSREDAAPPTFAYQCVEIAPGVEPE